MRLTIAILWTLSMVLFLFRCNPALQSHFATGEDIIYDNLERTAVNRAISKAKSRSSCFNAMNYAPDSSSLDYFNWKYMRVNFHWINAADSSSNYGGQYAIDLVKGMVAAANKDLRENRKQWLPYGNDIPVFPAFIQYQITPQPDQPGDEGIYFHYDDEICYYIHKGKYRNLGNREVFNRYAIGKDSILNIFIMPHHPDSVASPTYTSYGVGVALGSFIKMSGPFETKGPGWSFRGIFNHEVGHILSLGHAWIKDGCADTPEHSLDCWSRTDTPPCDTAASNNMMDYNAVQHALTPCQIGKMHARIADERSTARKFFIPKWCTLNPEKTITIRDSVEWRGSKDLEGNLIIEEDQQLTIYCRVSIPAGGKIVVKPGGSLVLEENAKLHNACGEDWLGIEIEESGRKKGALIFRETPTIENTSLSINNR